jgi:hypothetical protein
MSKYQYYVSQQQLTGLIVVVRKGRIFTKFVAYFRDNDEGRELAEKYCEHLNYWFDNGTWRAQF